MVRYVSRDGDVLSLRTSHGKENQVRLIITQSTPPSCHFHHSLLSSKHTPISSNTHFISFLSFLPLSTTCLSLHDKQSQLTQPTNFVVNTNTDGFVETFFLFGKYHHGTSSDRILGLVRSSALSCVWSPDSVRTEQTILRGTVQMEFLSHWTLMRMSWEKERTMQGRLHIQSILAQSMCGRRRHLSVSVEHEGSVKFGKVDVSRWPGLQRDFKSSQGFRSVQLPTLICSRSGDQTITTQKT